MNINEKIINIQTELKAPKNLYNKFGKYNYRNAESILEGLKPLAKKYGVLFTLQSMPVVIGEHYFLMGTITATDAEKPEESLSTTTYCEMDFNHAGMSAEQKMGACSSYLNKYLLGNLLLLDDNKDPDTDEYHEQASGSDDGATKKTTAEKPTNRGSQKEKANADAERIDALREEGCRERHKALIELAASLGYDEAFILQTAGVSRWQDLPNKTAQQLTVYLNKKKSVADGNKGEA